jgi:hypothetical protein
MTVILSARQESKEIKLIIFHRSRKMLTGESMPHELEHSIVVLNTRSRSRLSDSEIRFKQN